MEINDWIIVAAPSLSHSGSADGPDFSTSDSSEKIWEVIPGKEWTELFLGDARHFLS